MLTVFFNGSNTLAGTAPTNHPHPPDGSWLDIAQKVTMTDVTWVRCCL